MPYSIHAGCLGWRGGQRETAKNGTYAYDQIDHGRAELNVVSNRRLVRLAQVRLKHVYPVTAPTRLLSSRRLGPSYVPLEAQRHCHCAVAIEEIPIGGIVASCLRN